MKQDRIRGISASGMTVFLSLFDVILSACRCSVCYASVRFVVFIIRIWMMASHVLGRQVRTALRVLVDNHVR